MPTFDPLHDLPSLSERAYQVIKEAILSLEIRPGAMLAIGALAKQLHVSRTPVRDALLRLEQDGLVSIIPQRGALVSRISEHDVREVYELRILLESYAARVAATRLTKHELQEIESTLQQADQAMVQGQRALALELGAKVHDLINCKVANRRFATCLDILDMDYRRIDRFSALIPGRLERSQRQHQGIYAALKTRDHQKAQRAVSEHLSSVFEDILINTDLWSGLLVNGGPGIPAPDHLSLETL